MSKWAAKHVKNRQSILDTTPEKRFSEILQDSLHYQRFSIPPHTHTHAITIPSNTHWLFTFRKSQQLSVFLFAIRILEFGKNNSVWLFLIDPTLMALSP
jgi:hypothetical protein